MLELQWHVIPSRELLTCLRFFGCNHPAKWATCTTWSQILDSSNVAQAHSTWKKHTGIIVRCSPAIRLTFGYSNKRQERKTRYVASLMLHRQETQGQIYVTGFSKWRKYSACSRIRGLESPFCITFFQEINHNAKISWTNLAILQWLKACYDSNNNGRSPINPILVFKRLKSRLARCLAHHNYFRHLMDFQGKSKCRMHKGIFKQRKGKNQKLGMCSQRLKSLTRSRTRWIML